MLTLNWNVGYVQCEDRDMQKIKILLLRVFNFLSKRDMPKIFTKQEGGRVLWDQNRQNTQTQTALDLREFRKELTDNIMFEFNHS